MSVDTTVKRKTLTYRYVASTGENRTVKGAIKASSEVAAQNLLLQRGYTPINLELAPPMFSLEAQLPSFFGVKPREVITFSRQLATLLESGVTLLPALQLLSQQGSSSRPFRRILLNMSQDLGTGRSFSQAIARCPKIFNEIYSRTIRVGESTGNLEHVLREMADHQERQSAFAKKVAGALTYPIMVLSIGVVVGGILITVALPPLADMFATMNADLPLPTQILMGMSTFANAYKLYIAAVIVLSIPTIVWLVKQPRGRRILDRVKLSAPLIGPPARLAELSRMSRTMAVLLNAGLPLQDIVELLPQTTTNSLFQDALNSVRRGLFLGQGLTYPMSVNSVFPPPMLQMVRVGEESNSLETNMRVLAEFYEMTAEEKTTALVAMITPVTTIGIAFVAGFIALSVIMPMYSITGSF